MNSFLNSVQRLLALYHGCPRKGKRAARTRASVSSFAPLVEELQPRLTPACTAQFSQGVLTILGTDANDSCVISRNAGGDILLAIPLEEPELFPRSRAPA